MTGSDGKGRLANATPAIWPRQYFETQIRLAILSGEFGAGDKLPPENDLAKGFRVSRPTGCEVLQSLAAAGPVDKVPGVAGGSFVRGGAYPPQNMIKEYPCRTADH